MGLLVATQVWAVRPGSLYGWHPNYAYGQYAEQACLQIFEDFRAPLSKREHNILVMAAEERLDLTCTLKAEELGLRWTFTSQLPLLEEWPVKVTLNVITGRKYLRQHHGLVIMPAPLFRRYREGPAPYVENFADFLLWKSLQGFDQKSVVAGRQSGYSLLMP